MTPYEKHNHKAKNFIDSVFKESKLLHSMLLKMLYDKTEAWSIEYSELSRINIFDLSSEQYNRKNYLSALLSYSEKVLFKNKYKAL